LPEIGKISPALEAWINDFRPTVLYTILGGNGLMELVESIRRRFDLPVVVHIMDDWVQAHHRSGLLAFIERRRMLTLVQQSMANATRCLAICDAMAEVYTQRYHRHFEAFQNTIDVARWSRMAKTDLSIKQPARLLYTGSILSFAQLDSLAACCRVVERLNAEGQAVELTIHAPAFLAESVRHRLEIGPHIRLAPPITDDELYFTALVEADVLLLPVNFDPHSRTFIRFSMPTKVPSYLVTGTPVLVYGSADVAQVEYAASQGWGFVVDQPDEDDLAAGMRRILTDITLRRQLSEAACRTAWKNHDVTVVRARFQAVLAEAAAGHQGGVI